MIKSMDPKLIEKLRIKQALPSMPGGMEAIKVTLQYPGQVPALTRIERKHWLEKHFHNLKERLGSQGVDIVADGISAAAQTLRLIVPVAQLDKLTASAASAGHNLDLVVDEQVL